MKLYQPELGYCYNSDSLFLYDFISKFSPKGELLDVGAGCGIIGLLLGRDFEVSVEAVEKQEILAKYAKKNAKENGVDFKLYEGDFLAMDEEKKYDYIVSNPPFYHDGVQKSSNVMIHTARYNEHLPLESFFRKVARLLKPHSHFLFCYDPSQFGIIAATLEKVKLKMVDVRFVYPRQNKKASLVMIHARNNSKSLCTIHPPLFAFEGDDFSSEAKAIYKKCATESIKCKI